MAKKVESAEIVACRKAIALLEEAIGDLKCVIAGSASKNSEAMFERRYSIITHTLYEASDSLSVVSPYRKYRDPDPSPDAPIVARIAKQEVKMKMLDFKD